MLEAPSDVNPTNFFSDVTNSISQSAFWITEAHSLPVVLSGSTASRKLEVITPSFTDHTKMLLSLWLNYQLYRPL